MSDLKCVGCEMVSRGRFPYFDPDCPVHGPAIRAKGRAGMSEPRTEAGKHFYEVIEPYVPKGWLRDMGPGLSQLVARIEEQAAAEMLTALENEGVVTWKDDRHRADFLDPSR